MNLRGHGRGTCKVLERGAGGLRSILISKKLATKKKWKIFLKFQVFIWSHKIDFHMGWEMEVWFLASCMWISRSPRTTCERGFLSSRHVFVKSQWSQLSRFNSGYSSLYPWSLSVYCASITGFFVTVSLWYNIKPGIVILLPLSFFSELF